jgi:serine phosphatase RsbU (regulator of sigma subunit)
VIVGVIRPVSEGFQVRLSTGGHPEPLLQRRDGTMSMVQTGGSLLGILPSVQIVTTELELRPGDRLVLYSDGVSEARRVHQMLESEGLAEMVRQGPLDAGGLAHWIEKGVLDYSGGRLQDDLAVLVLQAVP